MLESLEAQDDTIQFTDIEHVQARILLMIYEFMRTNHQRGWISAGRCFRLVQLMRLYEIDSPENVAKLKGAVESENWVKTEVNRRTFWVAYSLDRFISMRYEWPLTLNEQDASLNYAHFYCCKLSVEDRYVHAFLLPRRNSRRVSLWRWAFCLKPSP